MWHIRKSDGTVYGPVEAHTLEHWAADGRIAPEDELSPDETNWQPASEVPEVNMKWVVPFKDGSHYGPVHILALRDPLKQGELTSDTQVKHMESEDTVALSEAMLLPLAAWSEMLEKEAHALEDQLSSLLAQVETLKKPNSSEKSNPSDQTDTPERSDLSATYETLMDQIKAKEEEILAAREIRIEIEKNTEERVQHLEKLIQHEQETTRKAQERLADLEIQHRSLVKSYRDLNERLIHTRQNRPQEG